MGMLSKSTIDIKAPADQVFGWLVEPAKILVWAGTTAGYPEDRALLARRLHLDLPDRVARR